MSRDRYLLDTSAMITFLENEPGAERVEEILENEEVFIPWLVLFEVYYIIHREKGQDEADNLYSFLKNLSAVILWSVTEQFLFSAARLKAQHRLSVADTMIVAYAIQHSAILLHKDPEMSALTGIVLQESLPFKTTTHP